MRGISGFARAVVGKIGVAELRPWSSWGSWSLQRSWDLWTFWSILSVCWSGSPYNWLLILSVTQPNNFDRSNKSTLGARPDGFNSGRGVNAGNWEIQLIVSGEICDFFPDNFFYKTLLTLNPPF